MERFANRGVRMEELDARWGNQERGQEIEVTLLFSPRLRVRVEETFGAERVEMREDGSLLVRSSYPDNRWMYGMILGYGPDVRVLEPAAVAAKIRAMGAQIAAIYEDAEEAASMSNAAAQRTNS
ncbi:WYL domain-containing protein [Cohnella rhizosphaerae]|uniref:WYL domain-containing protein n=1 Tax=Cohnella rhizosphaerae TaxID=1457232 RepID=A0A9X4KS08_9BACL|nr:WYL domain-containing protein [Cohnella rhizosphaerae]MDG0809176.1 WYL domain-containing protein [Cohnella rhizosphaerae]